MSQPIRYGLADEHLGRIHPQEDGHLVMWSDYAALVEAGRRADVLLANIHAENQRLAAENKRLTHEKELIEGDWEMMAAFIFEEKLNDLLKSWFKVNYDQWYKRSYPKWGSKSYGRDSSLAVKNAALAAENERLNSLLLDLSDAVHFHRANADTAKCSATIDRIVAEVDKMHPIS